MEHNISIMLEDLQNMLNNLITKHFLEKFNFHIIPQIVIILLNKSLHLLFSHWPWLW
jgi:hypothetical protein